MYFNGIVYKMGKMTQQQPSVGLQNVQTCPAASGVTTPGIEICISICICTNICICISM